MKQIVVLLLSVIFLGSCVKPNAPTLFVPNFWSWSGSDGMDAIVNGKAFVADSAACTYAEALGWKSVSGTSGDNIVISVASQDFTVGSVYELHTGAASSNASYVQVSGEVASTNMGSKGQCKILENDATHIKGLFYFETVAPVSGTVLNVSKGYFNVTK